MMNRLFKILPILAIVVGIGGAWASQAEDSPCETRGTPGYQAPPDPTAGPDAPTNSGIVSLGQLGNNFGCDQTKDDKCFWTYSPGHPEADPNGWIECEGEYTPNP